MKNCIDLNKEKVKEFSLDWTACDVAYQLEHFLTLEPKTGGGSLTPLTEEEIREMDYSYYSLKDYKIIEEHTEEHRECLQEIMQDVIEDNQDKISEVINDALWDYLVENKKEIIETLIDNKYIEKQ